MSLYNAYKVSGDRCNAFAEVATKLHSEQSKSMSDTGSGVAADHLSGRTQGPPTYYLRLLLMRFKEDAVVTVCSFHKASMLINYLSGGVQGQVDVPQSQDFQD